jgi:hypothetical protein
MLAQSHPLRAMPARKQAGPLADPGMNPVRPDDPSAPHRSPADLDPARIERIYSGLPTCYDARVLRTFDEDPMQHGPADAHAELMEKKCFGFELIVHKAYAAEREPVLGIEPHADPPQRRNRIGHQAFTASLVDRGMSPVRNNNLKAVLAGCQRSGESGRTAPNHEDVGVGGQAFVHHRTRIISEQNPGPIAKSTP